MKDKGPTMDLFGTTPTGILDDGLAPRASSFMVPPHRKESDTSRAAAHQIAPKFSARMLRYVEWLQARPDGATDHEACQALGMLRASMCGIRNKAMEIGKVRLTSKRRPGPNRDHHGRAIMMGVYVTT